jgi:hypothetical protein
MAIKDIQYNGKKDIQYNDQKRHTIQWPKKTYNTMANKDIQYNGQKRTRPRGHTMIYKTLHR